MRFELAELVTSSELPALETELGKCSTDCGLLPIFLLVLLVIMFVTFLNNVPGTVVNLKSVSPRQRSIGTSTQQLIARLFGSVPGPLVFGAVLDSSCQLWESKCGSRGLLGVRQRGPPHQARPYGRCSKDIFSTVLFLFLEVPARVYGMMIVGGGCPR